MRVPLHFSYCPQLRAVLRQTARRARPLTAALVGDRQSMALAPVRVRQARPHPLHIWSPGAAALDPLVSAARHSLLCKGRFGLPEATSGSAWCPRQHTLALC